MNTIKNDLILTLKESFVNLTSDIISTILILVVAFMLYSKLKKIVIRCLSKTTLDESVIKFIGSIMNVATIVVVGIIVLSIFNFPVSSIVAIFSAMAVGIGLSFKESLGNLGAGAILLWSKQFKTGDYVSCMGIEGSIHAVTAFTVMLRTTDNKIISIPNSKIINDTIINFSSQETRRMNVTITLPYGTDTKKVKNILSDIIEGDERILKEPKYIIGIRSLKETGIEVLVAPWVSTDNYWEVYYSLMDSIVIKFGENKISAPCTKVEIVNDKDGLNWSGNVIKLES